VPHTAPRERVATTRNLCRGFLGGAGVKMEARRMFIACVSQIESAGFKLMMRIGQSRIGDKPKSLAVNSANSKLTRYPIECRSRSRPQVCAEGHAEGLAETWQRG